MAEQAIADIRRRDFMSTRCSNVDCPHTPLYLIEFSVIGNQSKATMLVCAECWRELIDNMGIDPIPADLVE
jgi:hypothetical protein